MSYHDSISAELAKIDKKIESMLEGEPDEVYGMLLPYVKSKGKRVRPTLAVFSYRAVGGKGDGILTLATLIEMFHNFTLIHDDIEDNSQFRRGEPTLHKKYGVAIALNSGDALYNLIWKELAELKLDCELYRTLNRLFVSDFKRVVEGQGFELNWEYYNKFDIDEQQYFRMVQKKTAALMGLSCETGALMGGADGNTRKALRNFGEKIGISFQIQDDVLNLTGDFEKYQKEIGGDITEGKRTLMVVHVLRHTTDEEREKIVSILSNNTEKKEDINYVIDIFNKYGSMDYAIEHAVRFVDEAKSELEILPDSEYKEKLISIADFVVKREK